MARTIDLRYPHIAATLEPMPLNAWYIWQIGADFREQALGPAAGPLVDVAALVSRTRALAVNGARFEAHWDLEQAVVDDRGYPVMGAVDYDPDAPRIAMISMNRDVIADRDELARSTAGHELGHAVFDVPFWMRRAELEHDTAETQRKYRVVMQRSRVTRKFDPVEWRANEFMGGLLAPRKLVHREMLKVAAELHIPRTNWSAGKPLIDGRRAGPIRVRAIADELAEVFGLSIPFMEMRLRKYQLVTEN